MKKISHSAYVPLKKIINNETGIVIDIRELIREDVQVLKMLPTKELFNNYYEILEKYWKKYCPPFCKYFEDTWLM